MKTKPVRGPGETHLRCSKWFKWGSGTSLHCGASQNAAQLKAHVTLFLLSASLFTSVCVRAKCAQKCVMLAQVLAC